MFLKAWVLSFSVLLHVVVQGFQGWYPAVRSHTFQRLVATQAEPPPPSNVATLKQGIVHFYQGESPCVLPLLMVDHESKQLIGLQTSPNKVSENEFNIDAVNQFFNRIGLNDGVGQQYKLTIVGVSDMSSLDPDNFIFEGKKRTKPLTWWQNETLANSRFAWPNSLRIETHMVSSKGFDGPPHLTTEAPSSETVAKVSRMAPYVLVQCWLSKGLSLSHLEAEEI